MSIENDGYHNNDNNSSHSEVILSEITRLNPPPLTQSHCMPTSSASTPSRQIQDIDTKTLYRSSSTPTQSKPIIPLTPHSTPSASTAHKTIETINHGNNHHNNRQNNHSNDIVNNTDTSTVQTMTSTIKASTPPVHIPTVHSTLSIHPTTTTTSTSTHTNRSTTLHTTKPDQQSTILKAPRPSTSTRTASAAPVQIKTSSSIKLRHKSKKEKPPLDADDEPIAFPISLKEKRARQAKRADQIKIWKVREEREAREARLVFRRKMVSGEWRKTDMPPVEARKKVVKFNLRKNRIIQLSDDDTTSNESDNTNTI
ncbi:hypothetical protein BDB01DRAFT_800659 [Pilobolus umbonatus]|nr:hypothetical protein BDB01DRAFT_800659 [Pilobolus umbonatus]